MVCYAPRLEPDWASAAPWSAPAAPRARPPLFLVREAVPLGEGYKALPPEAEMSAAALPESEDDVLDALEEEIVVLSAHIQAATHRLLTLIAEYDRLRGWELAGHRSCAHWLAYRTGLDLGAAREKVRAARALERLPETSASMARGELSFSQVRALSRVATAENEGHLLELARGCTTAQLERMVRAFRRGSEADEAAAEKRRYQSRTLSVFPDDDGMYVVRGRLTAEEGALLMRAIEAAGDALYREERWSPAVMKAAAARGHVLETETEREAAQRRADALGLVAERALAAGFGGRRRREESDDEAEGSAEGSVEGPAGRKSDDALEGSACAVPAGRLPVPISGSRAERYQVVLHMEAETLRPPQQPDPWEPGETSEGGVQDVSYESSDAEDAHVAPALRSAVSRTGARARPAQSHLRPLGSCERSVGANALHPSLCAPKSELDDGTRVSAEGGIHLTGVKGGRGRQSPRPFGVWAVQGGWVVLEAPRGWTSSLGTTVSDQFAVGDRLLDDGPLQKTVEDQSTGATGSPVEPEHEFVQVAGQVLGRDGSLVRSKEPSFRKRGNTVNR